MSKPPIKKLPEIRLHPIDKDIIRALASTRLKATPSQVSRAIGVHPATAQRRIQGLVKKDIVQCQPRGNRKYCTVDINKLKTKFKKNPFWR